MTGPGSPAYTFSMARPEAALWEITHEKVREAVKRIVQEAQPLLVILFGSYVRDQTGPNSDVDILVVMPDEVQNPRQESVHLRRALRDIFMPTDIIVVPRVGAAEGDTRHRASRGMEQRQGRP